MASMQAMNVSAWMTMAWSDERPASNNAAKKPRTRRTGKRARSSRKGRSVVALSIARVFRRVRCGDDGHIVVGCSHRAGCGTERLPTQALRGVDRPAFRQIHDDALPLAPAASHADVCRGLIRINSWVN